MLATYITEQMRAAVGSVLSRRVSYPVSASDIRRWSIAIYYPDEPPTQFWDGEIVAPEEFNPFAWMVAEPAGEMTGFKEGVVTVEADLGLPEVATDFMLNGGSELTYGASMSIGDVITSSRALDGYNEREGRLGTMLFTRMRDTWTNQRNDVVKSNITTLIRY